MSKTRHIPQRSCVVCRQVRPKPELNRLVRGVDGKLTYDATGKAPGRGAYVCGGCLERDLKRERLEQALRGKVDTADLARARQALHNLAPSR